MPDKIQSEGFEVRLTVNSEGNPSPIVNERGSKWQRGFFHHRKENLPKVADDDDSVSVSSWKSSATDASDRSRRSWRDAFRRRKKPVPKEESDNDSIESRSNKLGADEASRFAITEQDEDPFPWLALEDSCYFFQCLCTPSMY